MLDNDDCSTKAWKLVVGDSVGPCVKFPKWFNIVTLTWGESPSCFLELEKLSSLSNAKKQSFDKYFVKKYTEIRQP